MRAGEPPCNRPFKGVVLFENMLSMNMGKAEHEVVNTACSQEPAPTSQRGRHAATGYELKGITGERRNGR